ncbi:MAG: Hsp33 family molecular chaperone HslO [Gammaproteobacteria bacterium]|nr:Hsp33 family molecular chaperone HslO [Gammaproteobacteria bacterium]
MHHQPDTQRRFIFEHAPIRGEIVHLDASWRAVLERHHYPPVIRDVLGQFMAATALLASTLKFQGSLILQAQGDGPLKMVVVECSNEHAMRALARWEGEVPEGELPDKFGLGRIVMTIIDNRPNTERYQAVAPLEGANVAEALQNYFRQSEQLDTHVWLAADGQQAAGLLLQKLPDRPLEDTDAWQRVTLLANTVSAAELLNLPSEDILHRLFHEEDVRLFDAEPLFFRCSCTRERVANMLRGLGYAEAKSVLIEKGNVDVTCEFCNQNYIFDSIDVEELFAASHQPPGSQSRH